LAAAPETERVFELTVTKAWLRQVIVALPLIRVGASIYRRLWPDLCSRDTCAEALGQRAWMDGEAAGRTVG
jgi:hypothetical protein